MGYIGDIGHMGYICEIDTLVHGGGEPQQCAFLPFRTTLKGFHGKKSRNFMKYSNISRFQAFFFYENF